MHKEWVNMSLFRMRSKSLDNMPTVSLPSSEKASSFEMLSPPWASLNDCTYLCSVSETRLEYRSNLKVVRQTSDMCLSKLDDSETIVQPFTIPDNHDIACKPIKSTITLCDRENRKAHKSVPDMHLPSDLLYSYLTPKAGLGHEPDSDESSHLKSNCAICKHCDISFYKCNSEHSERSNSFDSAVLLVKSDRFSVKKQDSVLECSDSEDNKLSSLDEEWCEKNDFSESKQACYTTSCMPSVIVSDYSNIDYEMCQGRNDLEHTHDLSVTLDDVHYICPLRKLSTCSTCSNTSSLSTASLEDDAVQSDVSDSSGVSSSVKKPSAWRKLRNVVHWSPFIQTYKKQKYPWVQLAGHQGNFKAGHQGTILKKLCGKEEVCLNLLMNDILCSFVPQFKGTVVTPEGETHLELQDLLADFTNPCVMDVKLGVRTYLEEELAKASEKPKLRKDMYEKMIQIDGEEPTKEENQLKAVTKPRYMVWRETISSTASLGFRIEGIKQSDGTSSKNFKTTKTREQVTSAIKLFTDGFPHAPNKYLHRLKTIYTKLKISEFFASHELIGSSLLFVHDMDNASIWLIDFAKTSSVPDGVHITHQDPWQVGNHEDGYLIGLNNLISIFQELVEVQNGEKNNHDN